MSYTLTQNSQKRSTLTRSVPISSISRKRFDTRRFRPSSLPCEYTYTTKRRVSVIKSTRGPKRFARDLQTQRASPFLHSLSTPALLYNFDRATVPRRFVLVRNPLGLPPISRTESTLWYPSTFCESRLRILFFSSIDTRTALPCW